MARASTLLLILCFGCQTPGSDPQDTANDSDSAEGTDSRGNGGETADTVDRVDTQFAGSPAAVLPAWHIEDANNKVLSSQGLGGVYVDAEGYNWSIDLYTGEFTTSDYEYGQYAYHATQDCSGPDYTPAPVIAMNPVKLGDQPGYYYVKPEGPPVTYRTYSTSDKVSGACLPGGTSKRYLIKVSDLGYDATLTLPAQMFQAPFRYVRD